MNLYATKTGTGPALIILHGVFGSGDNWATVARALSAHFEVHTLDLRNHGKSPHDAHINYALMTQDLIEYFDTYNIEKAMVLGHSMGGKVAMNFALNHPQRVSHLVVVDIGLKASDLSYHEQLIKDMKSVEISAFNSRSELEIAFKAKISDYSVRQFLLKNIYRTDDKSFTWRYNLAALEANIDHIGAALEASDKVYEQPTLLIRGGNSKYVSNTDFNTFAQHFSSCSLLTINGAGHWVHADKPLVLLQYLTTFLLNND